MIGKIGDVRKQLIEPPLDERYARRGFLNTLIERANLRTEPLCLGGSIFCTRDTLRQRVFFGAQAFNFGQCRAPFAVEFEDAVHVGRIALPCRRTSDTFGIATDKSDIEQKAAVMRTSGALLPGQAFEPSTLLAPAQAILAYRARVALAPLGEEELELDASFGRILARDVDADARYPAHPRSTMDGFAVRSADATAQRTISGDIRMGHAPPRELRAGEAMRIPTGGAVPEGADAVVPFEDVDERDRTITLREMPEAGDYITPAGQDMEPGDRVLPAGRRVDAGAMGVLATLGYTKVAVYRRPTIAIVSTGDELVDPSQSPGPGQVRDSNRYALAGAVRQLGGEALHLPRAIDEREPIEQAIRDGLARADAVLLTGGSSVGMRDMVPRAIERLGQPGIVVHGLRVRPGKPTVLAAVGNKPVIGLPGNPTSALMIFRTIAAPILRGITGETLRTSARSVAEAGAPIRGREGWTVFIPVYVVVEGARRVVTPLELHSSHTSLLARAEGFVVLPEDRSNVAPGEQIEVHTFDGGEI